MSYIASVIIPAHNEEGVIDRCLTGLLEGQESGVLEVIVVANGCQDRTVEFASRHLGVQVLQLSQSSKSAALNAGDVAATTFPRFYVDADVELSFAAVVATVLVLGKQGAVAASPRLRWQAEGRSLWVQSYYSVWSAMPYASDGLVGVGVYALNELARARFDTFPEIIADDLFIRSLYRADERIVVDDAEFIVHPPYDLKNLLKVLSRVWAGNLELKAVIGEFDHKRNFRVRSLVRGASGRVLMILRRPDLWRHIPVHLVVYLSGRGLGILKRRRGDLSWARDVSTR